MPSEKYEQERGRILNKSGLYGKKVYITDSYLMRAAIENGKNIYTEPNTKRQYFIELSNLGDVEIEKLIDLKILEYTGDASRRLDRMNKVFHLLFIVCIIELFLIVLLLGCLFFFKSI